MPTWPAQRLQVRQSDTENFLCILFAQRRKIKKDRQCTYNVKLRRVRANIFAVENKYYIF
jgi:hypothetical protein